MPEDKDKIKPIIVEKEFDPSTIKIKWLMIQGVITGIGLVFLSA